VIVLYFKPPDLKKIAKPNAFIGKFIDQTFHVVERVRVRIPWKCIDAPLGRRTPRLRTTALYNRPWVANCGAACRSYVIARSPNK